MFREAKPLICITSRGPVPEEMLYKRDTYTFLIGYILN